MTTLTAHDIPRHQVLDLFAGPGGWDLGASLVGVDDILGVEVNQDACATARAAGFNRLHADVLDLDPAWFGHVTGLIASPPCPTFSAAGKGTGRGVDYQQVLDCITALGSQEFDTDWDDIRAWASEVTDPRTALVLQAVRFALTLPNLEWVAMEQVPDVEFMFEDIAAELFAAGWATVDVGVVDAVRFGAASRRRRAYLVAHRTRPGLTVPRQGTREPGSAAHVLGWPAGHRINTRGTRRTAGGNEFSADGPSWCLTGKARTWKRAADGVLLDTGRAGVLNGFPAAYPWQGSRTSQFQQLADVVNPIMAAALLAPLTGTDPHARIGTHLDAITA